MSTYSFGHNLSFIYLIVNPRDESQISSRVIFHIQIDIIKKKQLIHISCFLFFHNTFSN